MSGSIGAVLEYLDKVDPEAAASRPTLHEPTPIDTDRTAASLSYRLRDRTTILSALVSLLSL
jgi:hypothetical protein